MWRVCRTHRTAQALLRPRSLQHNYVRTFGSTSTEGQPTPSKDLPTVVDVVIVGGGVVGCSSAYHLAKLGKSVLLLEQNKLTSGTTWHAAGLIGISRGTEAETKISLYGSQLYEELESETGHSTGFKRCGSLTVARTPERLQYFERVRARLQGFGVPAEMVSPQRCGELWAGKEGSPLIRTEDLAGGLWMPMDGSASPTDVCISLAKGAKKHGARLEEGVRVSNFIVRSAAAGRRRIVGVETEDGTQISAEAVLLCAGQWTRHLAAKIGVNVPLHSCEHFYVVTHEIPGVRHDLPVLRDPDACLYMREWGQGLCIGSFEEKGKPIFTDSVPRDFAFSLFPDDWDHFSPLFSDAIHRIPALETASVKSMINGPESFTPDMHYILGETPEVDRLYVCSGMNSSGIASAAGAGRAVSEWIVNGEQSTDLWSVDVRRFSPLITRSPVYLRERVGEVLGMHYAMPWPKRQPKTMRNLRHSALFSKLDSRGAVWEEKAGWERPQFFAPNATEEEKAKLVTPTFGIPANHGHVAMECKAAREGVAVFDQSSFSKYLVQGRDAEAFLNRVCANNIAVEVGRVVYTPMLNKQGGFEADVTVTRNARDEFYIISSTGLARRDLHRLRSLVKPDQNCVVNDVTGQFSVISVMGPRSRELLASISFSDFSPKAFPFYTSQDVDIGPVMVTAKRVSYVGELGWELHAPVESAHAVYQAVVEGAQKLNLPLFRDAGYHAIDSLRIEKGMRSWGHDLDVTTTPIDAGLMFSVDMRKEFIGREALFRLRDGGSSSSSDGELPKRFVSMLLADPNVMLWGGELFFLDGKLVGRATSAAYGHTLGAGICMGYVKHEDIETKGFVQNAKFEVEVEGKRIPVARATLRALLDPTGVRMKDAAEPTSSQL